MNRQVPHKSGYKCQRHGDKPDGPAFGEHCIAGVATGSEDTGYQNAIQNIYCHSSAENDQYIEYVGFTLNREIEYM